MAMTVVGLFERISDAQSAQTELMGAGFAQSDITVLRGDATNLEEELGNRNIPGSDVRLYKQGLRSGDTLIALHAHDNNATQARDIMNRHNALDIHQLTSTRTQTVASTATAVATSSAAPASASIKTVQSGETVTVPVVEEELVVGKRAVEGGGARIHTSVTETPVSESVTLREEEVVVDRVAVNRPATQAELNAALQEKSFEVTTKSEEVVVGKTARIVEEVTIGKEATDRTETVTDTVRRTDVDVVEVDATMKTTR